MYQDYLNAHTESLGPGLNENTIKKHEATLTPYVLTTALEELYLMFNGGNEHEGDFLTFEQALEERENYQKLLGTENIAFAQFLFPIFSYNYGNYWVPLSREKIKDSPVFEYAISEGDSKLYLIYNSVEAFIDTLCKKNNVLEKNKYEGTKGHYVDTDLVERIYHELNPDAYNPKQKGKISENGVYNVYEINNFPSEWA